MAKQTEDEPMNPILNLKCPVCHEDVVLIPPFSANKPHTHIARQDGKKCGGVLWT